MRGTKKPEFLERAMYRRRRMADAARILPILGIVLLALPMLWSSKTGEGGLTTHVMGYIFGVWIVLAALAAALSTYLAPHDSEAAPDEDT